MIFAALTSGLPQRSTVLPKPYHLDAAGLPNVYLLNGVKVERDAGHGELVAIDRLPELIMAIAFSLKPDRLTGASAHATPLGS